MYVAYVHVHTRTWIYEELNDPLKLTMKGSNDEFGDLEKEDENVHGHFSGLVDSSPCSYDVQSSLSVSLPSTSVPIPLLHVKHTRTCTSNPTSFNKNVGGVDHSAQLHGHLHFLFQCQKHYKSYICR